jgi:membrane protease YdiL (CAAX protease family)
MQKGAPGMASAPVVGNASPRAVAPVWHTLIVLAVLATNSMVSGLIHDVSPIHFYGHVGGYLYVLVLEWAVVGFIWWGIGRRGVSMAELIGGKWSRPLDFIRDFGLAIVLIVVIGLIGNGLGWLLKATPGEGITKLFPHGLVESVVFVLLGATAGFCEEVIFRGYFQRQFGALARGAAGGIVLQAIVFGAGHGYQGWKFMVIIVGLGLALGVMAHWRRSLRPGMIAHFLQDGVLGLIASRMMR